MRPSGSLRHFLGSFPALSLAQAPGAPLIRLSEFAQPPLGNLYDCDFNQMLGMPIVHREGRPARVTDLLEDNFVGSTIRVADHCFGCTAGQGSSCSGALHPSPAVA
ncbi:DUF3641 domain-containing protein [Burkholderia glumae]|uniref:DUF3641 domain-containing protein n=1 Tax=Burkholderia glumae TaxID=337 RepID=UPI003B9A9B8C